MKSSNIHISDCVDNETFEALVEMAGLSRFDDLGDPKDEAEDLFFSGEVVDQSGSGKILEILKNDVDGETFSRIAKDFGIKPTDSIRILLDLASFN